MSTAIPDPAELNRKFGIPGVAEITSGNGGLPKVRVESAVTEGEIYLYGAHVAAWRPAGAQEVLWLSNESFWQPGKPIRGGVPICFPWFGGKKEDPQAPVHGFARLRTWRLESITQEENDSVTVVCSTETDEATRAWSPIEAQLRFSASFGTRLVMALEVTNTGQQAISAEEALHTYFSVGDARQARVHGLDGLRYLDKVDGAREKTQNGVVVISEETDRVYLDTQGAVEIEDPVLQRRIRIAKENSLATVVWNPWIAKSKAMPDFGDEEWQGMLCVETANAVRNPIALAPGQQHTLKATIEVLPI